MKKVLVLGASSGVGYSLVKELVSRGVEVVAFARGKEKLSLLYSDKKHVTIFLCCFLQRQFSQTVLLVMLYSSKK